MHKFQISAVEPAFESPPVLGGLLGIVSRAVAMGLLREPGIQRLDAASLRNVLDALQSGGLLGGERARLAALLQPRALHGMEQDAGMALQRVIDILEESPAPATEWAPMRDIFGDEVLADLLLISVSSLRRYAAGERATPTPVADRLHWVAMVVSDLAGSYNEYGIRRWFERERSQLDGRSPRKLLGSRWQSTDASAYRIRTLAANLVGAGAT